MNHRRASAAFIHLIFRVAGEVSRCGRCCTLSILGVCYRTWSWWKKQRGFHERLFCFALLCFENYKKQREDKSTSAVSPPSSIGMSACGVGSRFSHCSFRRGRDLFSPAAVWALNLPIQVWWMSGENIQASLFTERPGRLLFDVTTECLELQVVKETAMTDGCLYEQRKRMRNTGVVFKTGWMAKLGHND